MAAFGDLESLGAQFNEVLFSIMAEDEQIPHRNLRILVPCFRWLEEDHSRMDHAPDFESAAKLGKVPCLLCLQQLTGHCLLGFMQFGKGRRGRFEHSLSIGIRLAAPVFSRLIPLILNPHSRLDTRPSAEVNSATICRSKCLGSGLSGTYRESETRLWPQGRPGCS